MILIPVTNRQKLLRPNAAGAASDTGDTTEAGRCWEYLQAKYAGKKPGAGEYAGCEEWSSRLAASPVKYVWQQMHTYSPAIASSICQYYIGSKAVCDQLAKAAAPVAKATLGLALRFWSGVGGALGIDGDCTQGRNTETIHGELFAAWKFAAVDALGITGSPPYVRDGVSYATSANQYASDEAGPIYKLLRNCGGGDEIAMKAALDARAATYDGVGALIHAYSIARVSKQIADSGEELDSPGGAKILLANMRAAKAEAAKLESFFAGKGVATGPAYVIPKEIVQAANDGGGGLGTVVAVVATLGGAAAAWYWRRPLLAAGRKVWRKVA